MNKSFVFNKKAHFDYEILDTIEAGIVLSGTEVKAIKTGHGSLMGAFAIIRSGEAWLINANIPPYQPKNTPKSYEPERSRKLLLNKKEINYLIGKTQEKGLTLVPIKLYNKKGKIKLEIGLGKGKKKFDKREAIKKKDMKREIERTLREKG
jgi:SsrA-binding protein